MLAALLVVPCPESDHVGCLPPKSLKSLNCRPFFEFWLIFVDSFVKKPTPPSTDPAVGRRRSQRVGSVFLLNCRSFSVKFLKIVELSSVFRVLVDFC